MELIINVKVMPTFKAQICIFRILAFMKIITRKNIGKCIITSKNNTFKVWGLKLNFNATT